uniref:Uncharacterized protein n=1 Tax=Anguilla anguilla TaxID=7936 RepID=A0A0E9PFW3_ANGAN
MEQWTMETATAVTAASDALLCQLCIISTLKRNHWTLRTMKVQLSLVTTAKPQPRF